VDTNGVRDHAREKTIANDSVEDEVGDKKQGQSKRAYGGDYRREEAGRSQASQAPAAAGKDRGSCPWSTGNSDLPCPFINDCPECCADPENAQMQKKQGKMRKTTIKRDKAPLSAETAKAVDKLLQHIQQSESSGQEQLSKTSTKSEKAKAEDDATEDDEDFDSESGHEDECGMTASEQEKPCWIEEMKCWETYVADKFDDWRADNYSFLYLSDLSQIAQHRLKTCTLGHFALTIAPNVDLWYVDAVKDMEEWSKRLAEELTSTLKTATRMSVV
jgi:hypothetical protein